MGTTTTLAEAATQSGFWREAVNDQDAVELDVDLSEAAAAVAVARPVRPSAAARWLPGLAVVAFVVAVVVLLGVFSTTPLR